jgi:hypothetical protein
MNILDKFTISERVQFTLPVSKQHFVEKLTLQLDKLDTPLPRFGFLSLFRKVAAIERPYIGIVQNDTFDIRQKTNIITYRNMPCYIHGAFREENNQVIIDVELCSKLFYSEKWGHWGLYAVLLLYCIFLFAAFTTHFFSVIFILIHAFLMFRILFFVGKRNVQQLKYELERDLYFMMR